MDNFIGFFKEIERSKPCLLFKEIFIKLIKSLSNKIGRKFQQRASEFLSEIEVSSKRIEMPAA